MHGWALSYCTVSILHTLIKAHLFDSLVIYLSSVMPFDFVLENGVTVSCGDGNMTISLEKQRFPYLNASQLHLRGDWCGATESSTHLFLITALNDCGTTYIETEDSLIFSNEIQGDVQVHNVITRYHDFDLQFNCTYSRKRFLSLSFTPDGIVIPSGEGIWFLMRL